MKYRFLNVDEYGVVELIYRGLGYDRCFPVPETAKVAVVEEDGKIVGMLVGQLLLQMGPVWIDTSYKGKVSIRRLQRMQEAMLRPGTRYFSFAGSEDIAKLCERLGMEKLDTLVYRKELPNGV